MVFALTCKSDRNIYGRLIGQLENDHTRGNYKYPEETVNIYQLLNGYKNWNPNTTTWPADGVTFSQKITKSNNDQNN